ncbi:MAG: NAD(P)/FAD-dependent oxidoreductase [Cyclobacteriaceae bacterium]
MKLDYILVGQGLAGSILSYQLLRRGKDILIINQRTENISSNVAAGIYNPITGRSMVKSWMADQLFSYLIPFYQRLEEEIGVKVLRPMPIFRPFLSVKEQNEWMAKSTQSTFQNYIDEVIITSGYLPTLKSPIGGLLLKSSGYVDIRNLLQGCRQSLVKRGSYREAIFDPEKLEVLPDRVRYDDLEARKIIFCQGPQGLASPFFNWLPYRLVKGEIILIETQEPLAVIVNRGIFVLPVGDRRFKVGATFNHHDLDSKPTQQGHDELIGKLDQLIELEYDVVDQFAGIRPATSDRRPFIGIHPKYEPLVVFNGLGTKGVSLAPYFSEQLVDFLEQKKGLDRDVNITRFFSLYFHSD